MHELSIALSIVDLAAEQARRAGAKRISGIELDIGSLSGVEIEALNFAMYVAFKDTLLEDAKVKVNRIQASCECRDCTKVYDAGDLSALCPACGGKQIRITRGMEMQLKSLLIE